MFLHLSSSCPLCVCPSDLITPQKLGGDTVEETEPWTPHVLADPCQSDPCICKALKRAHRYTEEPKGARCQRQKQGFHTFLTQLSGCSLNTCCVPVTMIKLYFTAKITEIQLRGHHPLCSRDQNFRIPTRVQTPNAVKTHVWNLLAVPSPFLLSPSLAPGFRGLCTDRSFSIRRQHRVLAHFLNQRTVKGRTDSGQTTAATRIRTGQPDRAKGGYTRQGEGADVVQLSAAISIQMH